MTKRKMPDQIETYEVVADVEPVAPAPAGEHNPDPRVRELETRKVAFEAVLTADGPVIKEG